MACPVSVEREKRERKNVSLTKFFQVEIESYAWYGRELEEGSLFILRVFFDPVGFSFVRLDWKVIQRILPYSGARELSNHVNKYVFRTNSNLLSIPNILDSLLFTFSRRFFSI